MKIKPAHDCQFDVVALGEVMLRLDPGQERIHTTRQFKVWEGGGEYNVIRGLRRCFQQRAAMVTALVDNPIGRLLEDLMLQGGVDMRFVQWMPYDGIGRDARIGLNFTERGFGVRGAMGCSDRGHSAASLLKKGAINWAQIFGEAGARWFHTGGIFSALSNTTPELVLEALQIAKKTATITSFDLNYRASLWNAMDDQARVQAINREIAKHVDVLIGGLEDFQRCFGLQWDEGASFSFGEDPAIYKRHVEKIIKHFPNVKAVATTLRQTKSANRNDWGAILWMEGQVFEATQCEDLEVFDRVGGGDSFAAGLIYALMAGKLPSEAINYGMAHGALAMTTPGDTSMATLAEVEKMVRGGDARVVR